MKSIIVKPPEYYKCSLDEFDSVFSHMSLARYRLFDRYIVPKYVNRVLEIPITFWYNLMKLKKQESDNPYVQSILENVVDHIVIHFPYSKDIVLTQWKEMWQETVLRYLEQKYCFDDYLIYITFQSPDYEDDNYHCHVILFDLTPSEENHILLPAINKGINKWL